VTISRLVRSGWYDFAFLKNIWIIIEIVEAGFRNLPQKSSGPNMLPKVPTVGWQLSDL